MADTLPKLAYDEAVRAITAQAGVLDNLRTRAGTIVAVASLVTSFLGGQALVKPSISGGVLVRQSLGGYAIAAIAAFVLAAVMAIATLWPYDDWRFVMSPKVILDYPADQYEESLSRLARFHEKNYDRNRLRLNNLFKLFRLACGLLVIETILWIIDLSS